jgi:O-Antigen ligase
MGLVLCARLAGSESRPTAVRVAGAAAAAPLGLGLYLTYSRGAIAAVAVGLGVLLAVAPSWSQLRAAGVAVAAGVLAAAAAAAFPSVASLEGGTAERETGGAIVLGLLVVVTLSAAAAQVLAGAAARHGRVATGRIPVARWLPVVAALAVTLGLAGLVAGGLAERGSVDELARREGASRLTAVGSRRHEYWRVAAREFVRHPLNGLGAGGFRVAWRRERRVPEGALEVHSLPLEMAAELGLPGLLRLTAFLGAVAAAGAGALRRRLPLAPGLCAGATVWAVHAAIDWDWQLPAVTLPALVMAGALVAASEATAEPAPANAAHDAALRGSKPLVPAPSGGVGSPAGGAS